jgi:AAA+ ATPase superfamily predicted ATPase
MKFLDRHEELSRLDRLARRRTGGLAVVTGRRRIGKTRLLLEWCRRHDGLYIVSDRSSPELQRRYVAAAIARRLKGFDQARYPEWAGLLERLAADARAARWRGPIVFDEFPYLIQSSPELATVLQRWMDHEARRASLRVVVAGSSQRMMQGLVMGAEAPLYGRASEVLEIGPLEASYARSAFGLKRDRAMIEAVTAWGGVPWYWELAAEEKTPLRARIDRLVLDPRGVLHHEPDRLLIEELPPAAELRPVLDAIGAGAHRLTEIAGRIGHPATSLARPLQRLIRMGLVRRETPFGEPERTSRRSLYRIDDPFFRLWFRVVSPHRALLAAAPRAQRIALLNRYWPGLVAATWEDLCRKGVPRLSASTRLGRLGPWGPASRWWHGDAPEWDLVAESRDGRRLLLGEAAWGARSIGALLGKPAPPLPPRYRGHRIVRALFVPDRPPGSRHVIVVTARDLP